MKLEKQYDRLLTSWNEYRDDVRRQILRLERTIGTYRVIIGGLGVTTCAGIVYVIGNRLGAW